MNKISQSKIKGMTILEFTNQLITMEDTLVIFAMKMTFNREKAKDLLQETYLKALTHKDQYVETNNFKAWTFTIMKNSFINEYRKSKRIKTFFDNTKDPYQFDSLKILHEEIPYQDFSNEEINNAIDLLDDKFKVPFRMSFAGYEYQEIAEILSLKIGTVKSRIFLCRKKLSKMLNENHF
jgi:RNA polymerase sigma-70 factor, ECF subfamily